MAGLKCKSSQWATCENGTGQSHWMLCCATKISSSVVVTASAEFVSGNFPQQKRASLPSLLPFSREIAHIKREGNSLDPSPCKITLKICSAPDLPLRLTEASGKTALHFNFSTAQSYFLTSPTRRDTKGSPL